ncbi:DUF1775 domain-containing protein [Deinococcus aquiradiocola]|uniref:YncI copper-binding domain-containing protein n=1 Tax=Deinococcus aquiradiocola TaxID=393059 RepID=A0A917PMY1_9DEIO|nr:DUF1775 domain-containing protein [Deinococcus aquiradiocola]GGJ85357.1 hypothetical protein GCM10008939_31580 [Deinococcus aquiradiocola]
MTILKNLLALTAAALLSLAAAHATVKTETGLAESKAGASETYRLQVPVEKDVATTTVRMIVPAGVKVTRFLPVPGFVRTLTRDANGTVTEVTWRGRIQPMEFQRFLFSATNPADTGTLVWKVYQTYADGSTVAWDDSDPATPASKLSLK